jgi:hypothetical protein
VLKALHSPQNGGEGMNGSERAERFDEAGILKKESLNGRLLQALDWSREILESSSHGISTVALKETSGLSEKNKRTWKTFVHRTSSIASFSGMS